MLYLYPLILLVTAFLGETTAVMMARIITTFMSKTCFCNAPSKSTSSSSGTSSSLSKRKFVKYEKNGYVNLNDEQDLEFTIKLLQLS